MKYSALILLTAIIFSCNQPTANTKCKVDNKGLDTFAYLFLPIAGSHGFMEIEMGRLAMLISSRKNIINFADSMIIQHSAAQIKYQKLMDDKGIPYPTKMAPSEQKVYDSLYSSGKDSFDQKYIDIMISDHYLGMKLFDSALICPTDTEYISWLKEMKKIVTMHYEMAKKLQSNSNDMNRMEQR